MRGRARETAVDAVVFDVGGVLLDWDPRHLFGTLIADPREREWFLGEVCGPRWNRRQDEGRSWTDAVRAATAEHPGYAEWIRAYDERWMEMVAGLYEQTVGVLRELREWATPVYALTNFSTQKWELARARYGPLNAFDGVVVSGQEGVAKPSPEIYRTLVERFDLEPARTFFTDDVEANVAAARAIGIDAEPFSDAASLRGQLVDRGVLPR